MKYVDAPTLGEILVVAMSAASVVAIVVMATARVSVLVVMAVALEVGTKSKASSQRLSQLFAESIEVVLGDCTFKQ